MPRTLSDIYGELYDELRAMVEKRTVELIKQDCDRCYIRVDEYDVNEDDIVRRASDIEDDIINDVCHELNHYFDDNAYDICESISNKLKEYGFEIKG